MQKPRTVSATTLPQVAAVPRPPMSGVAAAALHHRSYHVAVTASSRPRRVSLNAPRHVPKYIFTEPTSVPWPRSLRGAHDICATVSHSRQRTLCKTSEDSVLKARPRTVSAADSAKVLAIRGVPFAADKLGTGKDEDSSQLNDGFDGGLSSSTLTTCSPKGPRHQPIQPGRMLKLQLDTAAIEDELKLSANSKSATAVSPTTPRPEKLAAYHALRLLFVPIWKLYRFHKQMVRATAIVAKHVLLKVHWRRHRRSERATDTFLHLLRIPRTKLRCAAHLLEGRVVRIQRAFRRHRARVQAVVELNYRKVRRDVEEAYWEAVVTQHEAELAVQQRPFSPVPKAVREVFGARAEARARFGSIQRRTCLLSSAEKSSYDAAAPSCELDVYSFHMIGRLPESLLRFEMTSAVFAQLRRSAARAHLMDDFSETRARRAGMESLMEPGDITPTNTAFVRSRGKCRAQMPRFLPESVYAAILNNTCYLTSLMRDDRKLRAHLRQREHHLESY
ncbi:hypothetical protein conserved [Leishmania donovani]|uniref:Hypothetical_protein_conserved n=1 Tax=Leishmania donovani TaxID=5661 RepID=A0A504X2R0_LEIDO|nr:hypothetical protein CGC20_29730 [Leishmania donovani]CAJ1993395.1 hypothetical protein conserved [Leishmania donovani]VDZ49221.1 hypothetical_protein_conserved [Leishmania donovani]